MTMSEQAVVAPDENVCWVFPDVPRPDASAALDRLIKLTRGSGPR